METTAGAMTVGGGVQMNCQWFLKCANEATTTEPHPVLGAVPICDRCAALVAKCGEGAGNA